MTDAAPADAAPADAAPADASPADALPEAAGVVVPPPLGWKHPARAAAFPEATATSREEFLLAHSVVKDKPDVACWQTLLKSTHVVCECRQTLATATSTGTVDVLVCDRPIEPPSSAVSLGYGHRTILYAAEDGALKLLLDTPTRATVDHETADGSVVGSVALHPIASPNGITFVDVYETDDGPWCPQAVKRAAAQRGGDWPLVHQRYAAVCAAAGRYVLKNGRLVKGG